LPGTAGFDHFGRTCIQKLDALQQEKVAPVQRTGPIGETLSAYPQTSPRSIVLISILRDGTGIPSPDGDCWRVVQESTCRIWIGVEPAGPGTVRRIAVRLCRAWGRKPANYAKRYSPAESRSRTSAAGQANALVINWRALTERKILNRPFQATATIRHFPRAFAREEHRARDWVLFSYHREPC